MEITGPSSSGGKHRHYGPVAFLKAETEAGVNRSPREPGVPQSAPCTNTGADKSHILSIAPETQRALESKVGTKRFPGPSRPHCIRAGRARGRARAGLCGGEDAGLWLERVCAVSPPGPNGACV